MQHLQRAIARHDSTIQLPSDVRRIRYHSFVNPELTPEELAQHFDVPVSRVRDALRAATVVASINQPYSSEETDTLQIEDEHADDPAALALLSDGDWVLDLMRQLPDEVREVIELRYGLAGRDGHEIQELPALTGHTRQEVNRLLTQGVDLLREAAMA